MNRIRNRYRRHGGSAPATPGFNAVGPEWSGGAAETAPAIPAPESTLGSHPCVALSSAQVIPEWIHRNLAVHGFPVNGPNPLNFVSHARGSSHDAQSNTSPTQRGERVSQGLSGVRRAAPGRKRERFTALLHHVTPNLLRKSYEALKKDAAPGVDGVT